jgi:8-oxo-dGTP pyrophosphatase MutT (NUDIX family)
VTGFRRLDEELLLQGQLVSMYRARFEAPDGTRFEREAVRHPGAVSVVPLLGDEVILVRQYRAPVDRVLLEIPAGKRDKQDEPPEETARRELIEEIGMRPGRLEKLAEFFNSPGFCDEHSHVYLGTDLEQTQASAQGIEEQHMTIERVALEDVPGLIAAREITDAKTIIGLCLARERLSGGRGSTVTS